jgi:succinyl-diaminopimelate desuccinylase
MKMGYHVAADQIDKLTQECLDFLVHICSIPALGPDNNGRGEMKKYSAIKETLLALHPQTFEEIHAPDNRVPAGFRPNVVALFEGENSTQTLWILTHMDVVPPGESKLWKHDPFKPYLEGGLVYGRGVEDNGQALAASIFAVRAVKETCGLGINVGLALVSDEETGSRFGLDYVLERRSILFRPEDMILVPDIANETGDVIVTAEKSLLHMRFTVLGEQGHASRPDKCNNTLRAAANFIVDLDNSLHRKFNKRNLYFAPPLSTFEPTRKDLNVPNVNTIPGEDVFFFDCRILPDIHVPEVLTEMQKISNSIAQQFQVETRVEQFFRSDAPNSTPVNAPVVIALKQAIQEVLGIQATFQGIGGQTVANFFRRRGLNVAVWGKGMDQAHTPNESISVENLILNTKVFAGMMVS